MLSKTKYCAYVQCPKNLWLKVHRPELAVEDGAAEERKSEGNEVGDLAMRLFGDFVEVTVYGEDGRLDLAKMIAATEELVREGAPVICEASFSFRGAYCAVDILRREGDGYAIYEVKSSTEEKKIYINDISYQKYVLEGCGIRVVGTYLITVNKKYVFDGVLKPDELFRIVDVGDKVAEHMPEVADNVKAASKLLDEESEPCHDLCMGCHEPHDCEFWQYCTRHLPTPSIFDVCGTGFGFGKKLEYYKSGVRSFADARGEKKIMKTKYRSLQITHELESLGTEIDRDGIRSFLDTLWFPLYFLDFETVKLVVPQYEGTKPNAQIPFQYSLHYLESEGGELRHKEFLAVSGENPLRPIAESLCRDIPRDACVIIYNKTFEPPRLAELADYFPDLAEHLLCIRANTRDLMEPFKNGYYYNREMMGSYSIKKVLPAVFPDDPSLDYANLEGIHNGSEAMTVFPRIKDMPPEEQAAARRQLLEYCKLDTYATVKLWEELVRVTK